MTAITIDMTEAKLFQPVVTRHGNRVTITILTEKESLDIALGLADFVEMTVKGQAVIPVNKGAA